MILLKSPETLNPGTGLYSRWLAAYNPMPFIFKREDDQGLAFISGIPYLRIRMNRIISEEERVSALSNPVSITGLSYNLSEIATVVDSSSGYTVLTFGLDQFNSSGDQNVNVKIEATKPGYKIQIGIKSLGGTETIGSWSAGATGIVRADIAALMSSLVSPEVPSKRVAVRYREVWDGFTGNWTYTNGDYFATYSAVQIGDLNGGNMVSYVTFPTGFLARWLTSFVNPIYNEGLPFTLSFIRSEYLQNVNLFCRIRFLDINKDQIQNSVINVSDMQAGINTVKFDFLIPEDAFFVEAQVYYNSGSEERNITQPIQVKLNVPCQSDPYVYLKWVNTLGGTDYFRFGYTQSRSVSTSNEAVVSRNILDWSSDDTVFDVIRKTANEKLQFGVKNSREYEGLKSLATSIKVMRWTNEIKFYTVELVPGNFAAGDTRSKSFAIQFTINLPDINIQRQ